MFRFLLASAIITLISSPVSAKDDGSFGPSFTSQAPSALMETPDSVVAQSVQTPDGSQMQNIMPAAGDEEITDAPAKDETTDLLNAEPTMTHKAKEMPAGSGK